MSTAPSVSTETKSAGENRKFCLRHLNHETKMSNLYYSMLQEQNLVDGIVSCEGVGIKVHRLVLSANSLYFKNLFLSIANPCQYPVIVLKDVPLSDLKAIIEFMYKGEVIVEEQQLQSVLKSAEALSVSGLTEVCQVLKHQLAREKFDRDKMSCMVLRKRARIVENDKPPEKEVTPNRKEQFEVVQTANASQISPPQTVLKQASGHNEKEITLKKPTTGPPRQAFQIRLTPSAASAVAGNRLAMRNSQTEPRTTIIKQAVTSTPLKVTARKTIGQTKSPSSITPTSSTWIPKLSPQTNRIVVEKVAAPVVNLEEDNQETSDNDIEEIDVKPPIFELENGKWPMKVQSESVNVKETSEFDLKDIKPHVGSNSKISEARSKLIKPSTSTAVSGVMPPPPPIFKVVQRSSARPLRNILKPPQPQPIASNQEKKTKLKKSGSGSSIDSRRCSTEQIDLPARIECPSCNKVFEDEKKWNDHLTNEHSV